MSDFTLYDAAKRYVNAIEWDEQHDDPHGGDEIEYAEDMLRRFITSSTP